MVICYSQQVDYFFYVSNFSTHSKKKRKKEKKQKNIFEFVSSADLAVDKYKQIWLLKDLQSCNNELF